MTNPLTLTLALISMTLTARSADRIWDGGGGDANWSTPANWGGNVPQAGDALFFGGAQKLENANDLTDGTSFSGLAFNSGAGAFTLSGNRLTLGGDLVNNDNDAQTVSLPMILDATRTVNAAAGDINVNGTLSGAGGLIKEGGKTVWLRGDSTFAGDVTVNNGTVVVLHSNALGSTAGKTTVAGRLGGYMYLGNNINLAEPLVLDGELNNGGTINSWGDNTLSGPITCYNQVRFQIQGGTLVISGGVTQSDMGGLFVVNSFAAVVFNTTPLSLGAKIFYTDAGGLTALGVSGNSWAATMVAGGTLRLDVPNALPPAASLIVGVGYAQNGTVDLNGCGQTASELLTWGSPNTGTRVITSAAPALLTANQGSTTSFDGSFTGAAGLCKTGTGKLTLESAATTTTGDFIVSNGTLVVTATASLGNSTKIVVAGGTLELQTGAAIADSASLSVADGGAEVLIDSGLTETVGSLFLGGVQQRRGTYGATGSGAGTIDDSHFSGSGKIRVLSNPPITPVSATWDAGGAGTLLNTPENWVGDATPALDGTAYATFGTSGNTATVNVPASLYGIAFNRDSNFTLENGDGALTLGLDGITAAAPSAGYYVYRIAEEVTLLEPQTWNVGNAPGVDTRLDFTGAIGDGGGDFPMGITKTGNGTLHLSGDNTYRGATTIEDGGIILFNSAALGSAAGGTVINTAAASGTSAWIGLLGGLTLAEPFTIVGGSVNGSCINNWGGTNTISGPITTSSARYYSSEGTRLNITGGVTGSNPFFVINSGGTIAFSNLPLNLGSGTFWADSPGLTVVGVAGNTWGDTMVANGTLRTDAANALPPTTRLKIGGISWGPNGTVDLNGFDQTVAGIEKFEPAPGVLIITSPTPATLTVNQSATLTYPGWLTGALSLVKTGDGSLTLTGASTTVGNFTVSNGVLAVSGAGTLGNSANVTVAATGTLSLQTSAAIADTATLTVVDGGTAKVELAGGVNEAVGWLWLRGKMRRAGTYGADGSGAQVIDNDHFSGTGRLTVLHDKSGTMIRLW